MPGKSESRPISPGLDSPLRYAAVLALALIAAPPAAHSTVAAESTSPASGKLPESRETALTSQQLRARYLKKKVQALEQTLKAQRQQHRDERHQANDTIKQLRLQLASLKQQMSQVQTPKNLTRLHELFSDAAIEGVTQLIDDDVLLIQLPSDQLFKPGRSSVSPTGKLLLDKIATVIAAQTDFQFRVEGHSDNSPLGPRLESIFGSNWGLSLSRAVSAVRYIGSKPGVVSEHLTAIGMGDKQPVKSNETPQGRRYNRRITLKITAQ